MASSDQNPKPSSGRQLARERKELQRTRRALSQEVEELLRKRAALSNELDGLMAARSGHEISEAVDALEEYNRRAFTRVLEREIHRCSREVAARFSTVQLSTETLPPLWFADFLNKTVRLSDLAVKIGPRSWWVFLSGAGGLGRRLFMARFARNLLVAQQHHALEVPVSLGGATYPVDGELAEHLVEACARRERKLTLREEYSMLDIEGPRRPPSTRIELLPPDGAMEPVHAEADPDRVLDAIQAAVSGGQAGEMVVRSGNIVGRVYIYAGKVAWAHCTSRDISLAEFLVGVGGIDPEEIKFAYDHCRQTGDNFAETLIEFGTFERDEMRGILCQHLRAHLDSVLELPSPELLFLPQNRVYNSDLIFPLSTLLSHRPRARKEIIEALRNKQVISIER